MSKSVENWLAANAPGDVRAFVNANQLRLAAQAETIAKLEADRARIEEILGPHLNRKMDYVEQQRLDNPAFMDNFIAEMSITYAEVRELQALLTRLEGT